MRVVRSVGDAETLAACFEELARLLWRQRHLLDALRFKLEVEWLLLDSGRVRWLEVATNEIVDVLRCVQAEELTMAARPLRELGTRLGLGADARLADVVAAAPEPWNEIVADHHIALTAGLAGVEALALANDGLLRTELSVTRTLLDAAMAERATRSTAGGPRTTAPA